MKKKLVLVILMSSFIWTGVGCSANNEDVLKQEEKVGLSISGESNEEDLPSYFISKIDNTNIGNCIRETLHIVVSEEYTNDQLYKIAEKEIKEYIIKNKVNALIVGFYESEDAIGTGYEMGRVEYVPFGEFGKAVEVKAGDYSNFQFVNLIEDKINFSVEERKEQNGNSNIEKIKNDFQAVEESSEITVTKNGDILEVIIQEVEDHPLVDAEENAIATYTDWALESIGTDIKILDITVIRPKSSVSAKLNMNNIKTDMGMYFDTTYIANNIY